MLQGSFYSNSEGWQAERGHFLILWAIVTDNYSQTSGQVGCSAF